MTEPSERPAVRVPAARCPYCHEEVRRGEEPAVCAACHALHHVGCLAEHAACATCGATKSRQAPDEQRPPALPGAAWVEHRRLESRKAEERRTTLHVCVTVALLVLTGVGASIGASTGSRDSGIGWAILAAAMTGIAGAALRGTRHGWGVALCAAAPGLLVFLTTSAHARERHGGEMIFWAVSCLTVGVALLKSRR